MPLVDKGNGIIEGRTKKGNELLGMWPSQLLADLRSVALQDGLDKASDDIWLLGEVSLNGDPAFLVRSGEEPQCWNCKDTRGFLAPTGDKDGARFRSRANGEWSPLHRKWRLYACPACQNPLALLKQKLHLAGIADPDAVIGRQIWRNVPEQAEMLAGVEEFSRRMVGGQLAGMLTLAGPFGCGKSTLSEGLVMQCCKASIDALYVTAERFKRAVSDLIESGDSTSDYLNRLRSAAVVVMDQVDWIRETSQGGTATFAAETFRDVFHHRYQLRRTHATVYVVNLEAWEKAGEGPLAAIYNRMLEGEVYVMKSKGFRAQVGTTHAALSQKDAA